MLWYVPNIVILITKTILTKDFFLILTKDTTKLTLG